MKLGDTCQAVRTPDRKNGIGGKGTVGNYRQETIQCVVCGVRYIYEYKGGRRRVTCTSGKCQRTRANTNRSASRRETRQPEPEYPVDVRRPNVSAGSNYEPMSLAALQQLKHNGRKLREHKQRRQGYGPDDASEFTMFADATRIDFPALDDYRDIEDKPFRHIPNRLHPQVKAWFDSHRVKAAGLYVGTTAIRRLPVLGSISVPWHAAHARFSFTCVRTPVEPLEPFEWWLPAREAGSSRLTGQLASLA